MMSSASKKLITFMRWKWTIPLLLLISILILSALRISGTSISVYSLNYQEGGDSSLLVGTPRGVRSDEWLVNTQMVVAQAENDFKAVNENIGNGQDMSLVLDVPYKDWSAVFKPQNLVFFILPLENAFALKWWLLLAILFLSCYLFLLEIAAGKLRRLVVVLLSLVLCLSPMIFWWYQSATVLPIAYSLLIMVCFMRLLRADRRSTRVAYSAALAYLMACFALILYPPFQIACVVVVIVFLAGWTLERYRRADIVTLFKRIWPYLLCVVLSVAGIIGLFLFTRMDAVKTMTSTVYPGTRIIESGGMDPLFIFSSGLSPNLQYDEKAASGYLRNQSEASNFLLVAPFLILPSLYVMVRYYKQTRKRPWIMIFLTLLLLLFMIRLFLPLTWAQPFYKLLLFDKVPHPRLLIGIGFTGILHLIFLIKLLFKTKLSSKELWILSALGGLTALAVMILVGIYTIEHFPTYISSLPKVLVFSIWVALGVFLVARKYIVPGLLLLVSFSVLSVYKVHPLYVGLRPLTDSTITQAIDSYPRDSSWAVLDDRLLINFPLITGRDSINSVNFYPQMDLWREIDPDGTYEFIYNRFAHVVFTEDIDKPFKLTHADMIEVKLDACSAFAQEKIDYTLSSEPLKSQCAEVEMMINTPVKTLFVSRITSPKPL